MKTPWWSSNFLLNTSLNIYTYKHTCTLYVQVSKRQLLVVHWSDTTSSIHPESSNKKVLSRTRKTFIIIIIILATIYIVIIFINIMNDNNIIIIITINFLSKSIYLWVSCFLWFELLHTYAQFCFFKVYFYFLHVYEYQSS